MSEIQRLVVGITGASGVIYGVRLLKILSQFPIETHLVMTRAGEVTLAHETTLRGFEPSTLWTLHTCVNGAFAAVEERICPLLSTAKQKLG